MNKYFKDKKRIKYKKKIKRLKYFKKILLPITFEKNTRNYFNKNLFTQ